jgi:hypothetical protein
MVKTRGMKRAGTGKSAKPSKATKTAKIGKHGQKAERKAKLLAERANAKVKHARRERARRADVNWNAPPPPDLVARLDAPKHKSKYHSYFEFAENTEKKKKLEYEVCQFYHVTSYCA